MSKSKYDTSNRKHGLYKHPLFSVWMGIKARCYNENMKEYPYYGGRGVIMCEEWLNDFKSFYEWALSNGWEKGLEIDKDIKGDGFIYSPSTCCFVSDRDNSNNRRSTVFVEYNGEKMPFQYACEQAGAKPKAMHFRMKRLGLDFHSALLYKKRMPAGERHWMSKLDGESVIKIRKMRADGATIKDISSFFKMSGSAIKNVLSKKTWSHVN